MKPTFEQVIAFAQLDLVRPFDDVVRFAQDGGAARALAPDPYSLAKEFACALLAAGRFGDDYTAAMETGWTLVMPYYAGRQAYEQDVATRAALASVGPASVPEGDMSVAEARAYVAGETGDIGEGGVRRFQSSADMAEQQAVIQRLWTAALGVEEAVRAESDPDNAEAVKAATAEWGAACDAAAPFVEAKRSPPPADVMRQVHIAACNLRVVQARKRLDDAETQLAVDRKRAKRKDGSAEIRAERAAAVADAEADVDAAKEEWAASTKEQSEAHTT